MSETTGDITVDVNGFRRQVQRFAADWGLEARDVMLLQMHLWLQDLLKMTPPKTLAQGRKAVERDLKKLFIPTRDRGVLEFFKDEFSGGVLPPSVMFNASGNEPQMRNFHKRFQGRDGRVKYRKGVVKRIGDIDFVNGQYVPQAAFNKYKTGIQKHVGQLKAGWVPAIDKMPRPRSSMGFSVKKVPSYVRRQSSKKGFAIDRMGKDGSGFLTSVNAVPYSTKLGAILNMTKHKRHRDMAVWLETRLEKVIAKENSRKVA